MVGSNIFYFQPYSGKIPILTNIFSDGLKPPKMNGWKMIHFLLGGFRLFPGAMRLCLLVSGDV